MRKHQIKMAEEFVQTLFEANDEIRKIISAGNLPQALDLLGQCQDSAIQLGNFIEGVEGEGFVTVGHLEAYCMQLYHFYEGLTQGQDDSATSVVNPDKELKKLRKQLIRVENSIKNDIKVRKEAVFLPYKASMWDALESVWKAADADEDCDAYVIPIPYYDRKPDRSFGEMHYEGDQYPSYVPITHYEDYNFEFNKPDMIFIHNPYDEKNLVTSVHPFFYSKNLKNFTEQLVYIPYFVLNETKPDDKAGIESMKHLCTTSAVLNADRVIVQSEDMKQIYCDVLSDAVGEESRPIWEEKILGLGSPKIDKVLNTNKEDVDIPEDWLRVIRKPDGSWKKIVLYNTSITTLLVESENMIEKMKDVFAKFKGQTDDITFLWRPHPLIPATIESMRLQLWHEYKKLMDDFRAEGWGIYDDTPDLDRAVKLGDIYYGDFSSVIELYKTTGNPVLIQDAGEIGSPQSKGSFCAGVQYNGEIYFFSVYDGLFCKLNLQNGKVDFLEDVFHYDLSDNIIVTHMLQVGEQIAAADSAGKYLKLVDLGRKSCKKTDITWRKRALRNIVELFSHGNKIYIVPRYENRILKFDIETMEQSEIEVGKLCDSEEMFSCACAAEDRIVLVSQSDNRIYMLDLETEKVQENILPKEMKHCQQITYLKGQFWMLSRQGAVCRYNSDFQKEWEKESELQGDEAGATYNSMAVTEDKVILLPAEGDMIVLIDLNTKRSEHYVGYPKDFVNQSTAMFAQYISQFSDENSYYYPMRKVSHILRIDKKTGDISWIKPGFPTESERFERYVHFSERLYYETNISVGMLLNALIETRSRNNEAERSGNRIWTQLMH